MPALRVTVEAGQLTQAPDQLHLHDAGLGVDPAQEDVAAVGLDGRPDRLDRGADLLFQHGLALLASGAPMVAHPFGRPTIPPVQPPRVDLCSRRPAHLRCPAMPARRTFAPWRRRRLARPRLRRHRAPAAAHNVSGARSGPAWLLGYVGGVRGARDRRGPRAWPTPGSRRRRRRSPLSDHPRSGAARRSASSLGIGAPRARCPARRWPGPPARTDRPPTSPR